MESSVTILEPRFLWLLLLLLLFSGLRRWAQVQVTAWLLGFSVSEDVELEAGILIPGLDAMSC